MYGVHNPYAANDYSTAVAFVALPVTFPKPAALNTVVILPRPLLLALVLNSLGDKLTEVPADRELTAIERTLADVICQQIAEVICEVRHSGWDQAPTISPCNYLPQIVRLFPGNPDLISLNFELTGTFGPQPLSWFWLEADADRLFGATDQGPKASRDEQAHMEQIVRQLPVELVIQLGAATLNLAELSNLEVGDVIVLNQRVQEPLQGVVADQPLLQAWPGRLGNKQAIQISRMGQHRLSAKTRAN